MEQECPYCKSKRVIKNGTTRHGKQNHKCKNCHRQFVSNPQNQPIPEATKQTNHMERFNCTLRQRVARLVRKTLSFSKKLDNHIAMIWLFVHHYNTLIQSKILIIPS
ncbi:MAG: hypothetical protein IM516_02890 [Pseudanabaena sp. M158S2SP1A06QC]|jgi:transposase-like protein|nr:hypothetical protein [Pseudanabaena sp. M090S1SP2A07QC]MCA6509778.1 hypothetical protein [Pseudanabaena sp. M109S1SP2A07QC]MCA6523817.1 hypothetical protein [Pseudanabaena sp. M051S1SP2A07QC]MCA6574145.1 hypothetical protein [Pseudanabaena sp. M53BS1SP1A06MG]MCA6594130.1 hypothetical protein [Pseudanabaena sp. M38BS1SP1A06MG]MCA6611061.1 hypothetical protein [Pseudanabaena sp. M158S2SP1A06QC]